jgi:hypothetical protein
MVNINMTHVFKHPKFYRIPRDKSDQAISLRAHDGECERAPDPGQSTKPQAPSVKLSNQPVQASSDKHQAPSSKLQAPSHKQQAPRS